MTQTELGEKIGVACRQISRWETGECEPTLGYLLKLGEALEVNISYLADQPIKCGEDSVSISLDGLDGLFDAAEELLRRSQISRTLNPLYSREMNIASNLFALAYSRTLGAETAKAEEDI